MESRFARCDTNCEKDRFLVCPLAKSSSTSIRLRPQQTELISSSVEFLLKTNQEQKNYKTQIFVSAHGGPHSRPDPSASSRRIEARAAAPGVGPLPPRAPPRRSASPSAAPPARLARAAGARLARQTRSVGRLVSGRLVWDGWFGVGRLGG